jgi:hypothetical protein
LEHVLDYIGVFKCRWAENIEFVLAALALFPFLILIQGYQILKKIIVIFLIIERVF